MNRGYWNWRVIMLVVAIILFVVAALVATGTLIDDGNVLALIAGGLAFSAASRLP